MNPTAIKNAIRDLEAMLPSGALANFVAAQPSLETVGEKPFKCRDCDWMLNDLRLWIERHLQTLHHRENKTGYLGSQNPQGYAVAEIPDWELRQKLDNIIKCLSK